VPTCPSSEAIGASRREMEQAVEAEVNAAIADARRYMEAEVEAEVDGRGLHSSTFPLNLSRI
jgi:hypothetical protein